MKVEEGLKSRRYAWAQTPDQCVWMDGYVAGCTGVGVGMGVGCFGVGWESVGQERTTSSFTPDQNKLQLTGLARFFDI
ncbi:hypothetical protein O988_06453 [Pseudogymnoascus sp. VKM F-3808]|nr:hypothetical protein O988_06453 [Pseudogymnoascus sp. VKM F-3808]